MSDNFTLENDKIRVLSSLFWIGGAITLLFVNLRVLRHDQKAASIQCEIENLESQLQKLRNKL